MTTDNPSNVASDAIVAHDFEEGAIITKEEGAANVDVPERPNNRGDLIFEVKQALYKAASKAGLILNIGNFPWAKLLQLCADHDVYMDNYPASVQRPGGPEKGGHSKGISNIIKQERHDIIKAINAPKNPLRFLKANAGGTSVLLCMFHKVPYGARSQKSKTVSTLSSSMRLPT